MKVRWGIYLGVAVLGVFACGHTLAGVIVQETFDSAGDFRDWTMSDFIPTDGGAQVSGSQYAQAPNGAFTAPGGSLQVDVTTSPVTPTTDALRTTGGTYGGQFLGDYVAKRYRWVTFDFYLQLSDPGFNSLQFYFKTPNSGGLTWFYNVDVSGQAYGTWATYTVPFVSGAGWFDENLNTATFQTDKQNITEIGFTISYFTDPAGPQTFGFDNIAAGYDVPGPGSYATLGFALVGLVTAFRRQVSGSLAGVRNHLTFS